MESDDVLNYPLPVEDPRAESMRDWLLSKHTTLWGEHFELVKDGPGRAVNWLIEQLNSYEEYCKANKPKRQRRISDPRRAR